MPAHTNEYSSSSCLAKADVSPEGPGRALSPIVLFLKKIYHFVRTTGLVLFGNGSG